MNPTKDPIEMPRTDACKYTSGIEPFTVVLAVRMEEIERELAAALSRCAELEKERAIVDSSNSNLVAQIEKERAEYKALAEERGEALDNLMVEYLQIMDMLDDSLTIAARKAINATPAEALERKGKRG